MRQESDDVKPNLTLCQESVSMPSAWLLLFRRPPGSKVLERNYKCKARACLFFFFFGFIILSVSWFLRPGREKKRCNAGNDDATDATDLERREFA